MNQFDEEKMNKILSDFSPLPENEQARDQLLLEFPEFKNSEFYGQTDELLDYIVFADFCRFLLDKINTQQKEDYQFLLERLGKFISTLYYSGNKNLKDLVGGGIFENLADEPKALILADFLPSDIAADFKAHFQWYFSQSQE